MEEIKNTGARCQEMDTCIVQFPVCANCLSTNIKERLLILDIPWLLEGREYSTMGTFVCCEEIDERQLLRNMIVMLKEMKSKEIL